MIELDKTTLTHFEFLDDLRGSGVTNMWGASEYLMDEFDMARGDAQRVLTHWMNTFSERQDAKETRCGAGDD